MLTVGELSDSNFTIGSDDMTLQEAASLLADEHMYCVLFRKKDGFTYISLKLLASLIAKGTDLGSKASAHAGPAMLYDPDTYLYKAVHEIEEIQKRGSYLLVVGDATNIIGILDPNQIKRDLLVQAKIASDIEKRSRELDELEQRMSLDKASKTVLEEQLDRFLAAASRMEKDQVSAQEMEAARYEDELRRRLSDELRRLLGLEPGFGDRFYRGDPGSELSTAQMLVQQAVSEPEEEVETVEIPAKFMKPDMPDKEPAKAEVKAPEPVKVEKPTPKEEPPEVDEPPKVKTEEEPAKPSKEVMRARDWDVQDVGLRDISVVYSSLHILHRSTNESPEDPQRLTKAMNLLDTRLRVFDRDYPLFSEVPAVAEDVLELVHDKDYIEFVKSYSAKGGGFLGDSTYLNYNTFQIATFAVGGTIFAADRVIDGEEDFSFALVRPPGHHASRENYGGYCLFNNAAVAAQHLRKKRNKKKIMILDWDVHAANGTQSIFYKDPDVLVLDIHQDPATIYPHTGFANEIGEGDGKGYTINITMPPGASDEDYIRVFQEIVDPVMGQFNPDFVIGCCGFDAHFNENTADISLTMAGYYAIAEFLRRRVPGKCSLVMEGGYHHAIGPLVLTMLEGLSGRRRSMRENTDAIISSLSRQKRVKKAVEDTLFELKTSLSDHFIFQ